jgi:NAD(P)-dependent dehydrogenase (short-subunit alcohol dehydrogenase family)
VVGAREDRAEVTPVLGRSNPVGIDWNVQRMTTSIAVTGAAAGLGRVVAGTLLERGRQVVLLDKDAGQVQATADELARRHSVAVPAIVVDLSSVEGVNAAADQLVERGAVDGLVNNAGGWLSGDQYPDVGADTWLSAITLNLVAPMLLTQRLWPVLSAVGGAVVNIGSSGGVGEDSYGSPEYGAAKAGLHRFTASLGSRTDVRVMCVVPGWIGLDRAQHEWARLSRDRQRQVGPLIPPQDIANVVVTLLDCGRAGEIVAVTG